MYHFTCLVISPFLGAVVSGLVHDLILRSHLYEKTDIATILALQSHYEQLSFKDSYRLSHLRDIMCGPENTLRPRGGALAVLHPSQSHPGFPSRPFNADLFLHTPGKPDSAQATRAVLMPSLDTNMAGLDTLHLFVR